MKMKLIGGGIDETVYTALQHAYSFWAHIDFGVEWIRNPGLLFRYPYQMYESERHKHWIHFLQDNHIRILAYCLLKNEFSLDKWHEMKTIEGIGFDILMKAIDNVELEFLAEIQKSNEKKETFDRLKLGEIFELQRTKNLVQDDLSDPEMSWLPGITLEEKLHHFVKRKKDENFLDLVGKVHKGMVH